MAICHDIRCLREFNVVLYLKGGQSWWVDVDKVNEVEGDLNSNKFDVWLMARQDYIIDNRREYCHVGNCRRVVDLIACVVVEAQDCQVAEVTPAILEEEKPVVA